MGWNHSSALQALTAFTGVCKQNHPRVCIVHIKLSSRWNTPQLLSLYSSMQILNVYSICRIYSVPLNFYVCMRHGLFFMYSQLTRTRTAKAGWQHENAHHRESSLFSVCTQSSGWMFYARCAGAGAFPFYASNQPCTLVRCAYWCFVCMIPLENAFIP